MARGGGGLATTLGELDMVESASQGYATGLTEGGLTLNGTIDLQSGAWVLANTKHPGEFNVELMKNYAHRAIHDLNLVGKAAACAYYGQAPVRSYYMACSAGGRQGYFSAYNYPDDFDGVLAAAPAHYSSEVLMATTWPVVVMNEAGVAPPNCVFEAFQAAIVAACMNSTAQRTD
jgi:feruloyl esterase